MRPSLYSANVNRWEASGELLDRFETRKPTCHDICDLHFSKCVCGELGGGRESQRNAVSSDERRCRLPLVKLLWKTCMRRHDFKT